MIHDWECSNVALATRYLFKEKAEWNLKNVRHMS